VRREGRALGALCVMGTRAEGPAEALVGKLERLAIVVEGLIGEHVQNRALAGLRRELEMQAARFRQTEEAAKVGGFEVDLTSGEIRWSDQVYRNVGLPVGTPLTRDIVLSVYAPEELAEMQRRLGDLNSGVGRPTNRHYRIITPQGEERWVHVVTEVEMVDGVARRTFGIVQDVSSQYRHQRALEDFANTDPLSGLGNRTSFHDRLQKLMAEGDALALLLVDVDRFKALNDTLGHAAGDRVLIEIACRLSARFGAQKQTFRLGGDEFAVLLSGPEQVAAISSIADELVCRIAEPFMVGSSSHSASVSMGGAVMEPGQGVEALCQNADFALYHAKETRRGGHVLFEAGLRTRIAARINALQLVEAALAEGRLLPHYQPVFQLMTGKITGVEALVRMEAPDGRIIPAAQFHDALADPAISYRVTTLMLERVAADMDVWRSNGWSPGYVGINVSSADFNHGDLAERIEAVFSARGLPLDKFILEVTESVLLEGAETQVAAALNHLRATGMKIALDDFGTGFASLTHLRSLPVDIIKIDKTFVDNIPTDRSSLAIIELVLGLAQRMGLMVVAEGIETGAQAIWLADLGCYAGQGYLFARPMSSEALQLFGKRLEMETGEPARFAGIRGLIDHIAPGSRPKPVTTSDKPAHAQSRASGA
jgi:diguanylate cyclase (GGDEF)-like protein/PAS domain S-box-containing protein